MQERYKYKKVNLAEVRKGAHKILGVSRPITANVDAHNLVSHTLTF